MGLLTTVLARAIERHPVRNQPGCNRIPWPPV